MVFVADASLLACCGLVGGVFVVLVDSYRFEWRWKLRGCRWTVDRIEVLIWLLDRPANANTLILVVSEKALFARCCSLSSSFEALVR